MDINLFTVMMRSEFLRGMEAVPADQLQVAPFTTFIPSTARIENYAWMTPSPGISEYVGHRRYAKLDQIKYTQENKEFDGSLSIPLRDIEDDILGGYPMRFNELGVKASRFPERWLIQKLAQGGNLGGFDGTNFFANTHVQGGSDTPLPGTFTGGFNNLLFTSGNSADGVVSKVVFMLHNPASGPIKPLLYQRRKEPRLGTNAGTPQSMEAKQVNYLIDLEAEALFGYWWDAILITITNTPSLTDIFTIIDQAIKMFLGYKLPQVLPSDPPLYVHQGINLTSNLGTVVAPPSVAQLFWHALNEERIGVSVAGSTAGITQNIYRGRFSLLASAYMV
jgi:phage major head subunit gpT-like protein